MAGAVLVRTLGQFFDKMGKSSLRFGGVGGFCRKRRFFFRIFSIFLRGCFFLRATLTFFIISRRYTTTTYNPVNNFSPDLKHLSISSKRSFVLTVVVNSIDLTTKPSTPHPTTPNFTIANHFPKPPPFPSPHLYHNQFHTTHIVFDCALSVFLSGNINTMPTFPIISLSNPAPLLTTLCYHDLYTLTSILVDRTHTERPILRLL